MNERKKIKNREGKLLVSFSAGETSGYMAYLLKQEYKDEIVFVFSNVGEENEETLIFADKCDKHFGLDLVWVEPKISMTGATKHTIVDFETAQRSGIGGNFEKMIQRFGIPNAQNMICTRELKERPITSFARSIGWQHKDYKTAIGIRADEIDRISKNYIKNRLWYPMLEAGINKQMVNRFWDKQPFRLQIKGYEGNCKWCWKKSDRKLATIYKNNPERFQFPAIMEKKYAEHTANLNPDRLDLPMRFFRDSKQVSDFKAIYEQPNFKEAKDDRFNFNYQTTLDFEYGCIGSCEPFS